MIHIEQINTELKFRFSEGITYNDLKQLRGVVKRFSASLPVDKAKKTLKYFDNQSFIANTDSADDYYEFAYTKKA